VTLLESLVALVILGLTAVAFLGVFQSTTRATRNASEWVQAVSYAEASMEQTKLGTVATDPALPDTLAAGFRRGVEVQPWRGAPGVAQVTVTVALPDGGAFVLHRLVRTP
jgi:type II secretory pathway pseudopilin PulG